MIVIKENLRFLQTPLRYPRNTVVGLFTNMLLLLCNLCVQ
jgi:hypothetical protein